MKHARVVSVLLMTFASGSLPLAALAGDVGQLAPAIVTLHPGESIAHAIALSTVAPQITASKAAWASRGEEAGTTLPTLTGGSVISNTIQVGDPFAYPAVQFTYTVGKAGLAAAVFVFVSPNGSQSQSAFYSAGVYSRGQTVAFESSIALSPNAQPGLWTLASVDLFDNAGNEASYSPDKLAKLFDATTMNVLNSGMIDYTPPVVTSGKVLTPVVSLSSKFPAFRAVLRGTDEGSGLQLGYVFIQPPGQSYGYAQINPLALPEKRGAVPNSTYLGSNNFTGTWGILGYALCDAASNCTSSTNPSDVASLFGTTTFTVAN